MKSAVKIFGLLISFITLHGCGNGNYKNVAISGTVVNKSTKQPIEHATVKVKCWAYSLEKWESHAIEKIAKTDIDGTFKILFEEGEAFDLVVTAIENRDYKTSMTLNKRSVSLNIELDH